MVLGWAQGAMQYLEGRGPGEGSLEYRWKHAERELEGGKTNDLRITQDGTLIKKYSLGSPWSIIQTGARMKDGRIVGVNIPLPRVDQRTFGEHNFREVYDGDVRIPEIIETEAPFIEMEFIESEDLLDYLEDNPEEVGEYASEVADFTLENHLEDRAFTDYRGSNFIVPDDQEDDLAYVDAESFTTEATDWDKAMDLITLISSVRQRDFYEEFVGKFMQEYKGKDEDLDNIAESIPYRAFADLTSIGHSVVDVDYQRFKNAAQNAASKKLMKHYARSELQGGGKTSKVLDKIAENGS
jgi:tRNA A-37 threonylcarbamoyl transferase component Bud32